MFKYIIKHIILDTIYFPIWWYSKGLIKILQWAKESLKDAERMAGLKIWVKAMFKPMFQDYTREGRIVSFFIRLVLLIFKLLMVIVWAAILDAIIIIWLGLPIGIVWLITKSI